MEVKTNMEEVSSFISKSRTLANNNVRSNWSWSGSSSSSCFIVRSCCTFLVNSATVNQAIDIKYTDHIYVSYLPRPVQENKPEVTHWPGCCTMYWSIRSCRVNYYNFTTDCEMFYFPCMHASWSLAFDYRHKINASNNPVSFGGYAKYLNKCINIYVANGYVIDGIYFPSQSATHVANCVLIFFYLALITGW